jgi:hypothetical protein
MDATKIKSNDFSVTLASPSTPDRAVDNSTPWVRNTSSLALNDSQSSSTMSIAAFRDFTDGTSIRLLIELNHNQFFAEIKSEKRFQKNVAKRLKGGAVSLSI